METEVHSAVEVEATEALAPETPPPEVEIDAGPTDKEKSPVLLSGGKSKTPQPAGAAAGAGPTPASYQANYKFKVLDKEHEFDDFLKGIVKDQDTEKKVRDLYERAFGLDSVKADRQALKAQLAETNVKITETDKALATLGDYVQKGDLDSFFEAMSIPKEKVLRYALDIVQREQDPAAKAKWESDRQAASRSQYYETQNQQLQQSQQEFAVQRRVFELDNVLSRPETTPVVQAYEAGIGSPGAFREYVIRIGQAFAAQGQDISAEQAVQEAVKHLRAVNPTLGMNHAAQQAEGPRVVMANQKPVLPNIQGRGMSAVRSTVKSIDDLKKRARELEQQGL